MRVVGASVFGRRVAASALSVLVHVFLPLIVLTGCAGLGRAPTPTALVISDEVAAYREVADIVSARLQNVITYQLSGEEQKARSVREQLAKNPDVAVVAVGPLATRIALTLSDRRVVYCQNFAPSKKTSGARGVDVIPPAEKQLKAWKMLDPALKHVVMLSGTGMEGFVSDARSAARRLGVSLRHINVRSDRELAYVVKRLPADVQGVWFLPDYRILSMSALRETLAYDVRIGRQSLVFSAQLLALGGIISVENDPHDVADQVIKQLYAKKADSIAALRRVRVKVNLEVAKQLGLAVPLIMQKGTYVF